MSIIHVAHKAGVSTATVSRVINRDHNVSEASRKLVEQAIQELGYQPPPPSRRPGPRTRARAGIRRNRVALLMIGVERAATFGNVFGSLLHGVEETLATHDLDMTVAQINRSDRLPSPLGRGHFDGLLLFGKMPDSKVRKKLLKFPCVWLLGIFDKIAPGWGDHITCDNVTIGQMAAEYLQKRGHRHVAFLNPIGEHPDFPVRGKAFTDAVQSARLKLDILSGATNAPAFPTALEVERATHALVESFVRLKPRPTGIFAPGDLMTALLYRELQSRGIKPGFDVDIVSCNNEQAYLAGLYPRPATISIGAGEVGRRGVERLLDRLRHQDNLSGETFHVPPRLVASDDATPWNRIGG